ncbi:UNVERIFIED_CONTAM: hypothetical protein K2H54_025987 [Gekko kuhli]
MAAPPDAASEAAEMDAKLRRDSDSRSSVGGGSSSDGGERRVDKFGFLVPEGDAPARETLTQVGSPVVFAEQYRKKAFATELVAYEKFLFLLDVANQELWNQLGGGVEETGSKPSLGSS